MNIIMFLIAVTAVLINASAQLLLKAGATKLSVVLADGNLGSIAIKAITQPFIVIALVLYVLSVAIWIFVLAKVPVSVAYPLLSIGYIANAIAAYYLFGESLNALKICGIFVIILGVILVAKSA